MDKIKLIKTFIYVVENGSLIKASAKLNITKAAVSKQIIDLENHLNAKLLNRTTRTMNLTEQGKLFYESAKKIFIALDEAESCISISQNHPIGLLRITSNRYFGEKYIVNNLKEFFDIYPNIKIDLELAERFPDLEKEKIDILFGIGYDGPDNLIRKKIASSNYILCASPEYLEKYGTPKTPEELTTHRYITHSIRQPDNVLQFHNKEIYLEPILKLNDAQNMLNAALKSVGIIKIHNYLAGNFLLNKQLVEILPEYRPIPKPIYVYYQNQKYMQTKIRVFLDFIYKKL